MGRILSRGPAAMGVLLIVGCARSVAPPFAAPLHEIGHLIPVPDTDHRRVETPALTHLLRGLHFLKADRPAAAVPHLRLALIYDPDSPYMHEQLALAWARSGRFDRAREVLQNGLHANPDDTSLNALAGELLLREQDFVAAFAHLENAVLADPLKPSVVSAWADAMLWLHPADQAEQRAWQIARRFPADAHILLWLAIRFEEHGELGRARRFYQRAREQRPSLREAAVGEMRVLALMGDPAGAADSLVPLFAFYPDALDLYVKISRLLRRAGREDGRSYRDEALRQAEDNPDHLMMVASGDLLEGETRLGIELLDRIVASLPAYLPARLYRAEVALKGGDSSKCLAVLQGATGAGVHHTRAECLAARGSMEATISELVAAHVAGGDAGRLAEDGALYLARAVSEARARKLLPQWLERLGVSAASMDAQLAMVGLEDHYGNLTSALDILDRLLQEHPERSDLRLRQADLWARAGRVSEALTEMEKLLREDPDDPIRLNALGFTLADRVERLQEASVWLHRAHRMAMDEGFILDSLGWLFYRERRFESATVLLGRAARASLGDPEILRHVGDAQRALGRRQQAREAYDRALRAQPSVPLQILLRKRLEQLAVPRS